MATREGKALEGLKIDALHKFLAKKFRSFTDTREENLKSIYKVNKAPSDSAMRAILDEVELKGVYASLIRKLREAGILEA